MSVYAGHVFTDSPISRRTLLGAGLTAGLAGFLRDPASPGRAPRPADYRERVRDVLERGLRPSAEHPDHPRYAGAVALVVVDGEITAEVAVGYAKRYDADA